MASVQKHRERSHKSHYKIGYNKRWFFSKCAYMREMHRQRAILAQIADKGKVPAAE